MTETSSLQPELQLEIRVEHNGPYTVSNLAHLTNWLGGGTAAAGPDRVMPLWAISSHQRRERQIQNRRSPEVKFGRLAADLCRHRFGGAGPGSRVPRRHANAGSKPRQQGMS